MHVVGLGAKDSFEEARAFARRHQTVSLTMLWDPTSASWRELGIFGQPAAILFDGDGRPLGRWIGPFDEAEVLERAASA